MGKILFIRGGAVGDFILTLPAIQLVRDSLPDNEIEILGYESIASLAVATGLANRVRSIEHAAMAPFFAPGAALDEEWVNYFKSFDVVISYLYDPDGFFCGNLERAGVETLVQGPFRMDESEPFVPTPVQLGKPLEQLALFLENPFVEFDYEPIRSTAPTFVIHPGSGSPSKNWSFENWALLASGIRSRLADAQFVIASGEAEEETIEEFLGLLSDQGLEFEHLHQENLSDLAKRIAGCDGYFGHDSGIGHLAATTGVPGLILFGPTNPEIWAPQHPKFDFVIAPNQNFGKLSISEVISHFPTPLLE